MKKYASLALAVAILAGCQAAPGTMTTPGATGPAALPLAAPARAQAAKALRIRVAMGEGYGLKASAASLASRNATVSLLTEYNETVAAGLTDEGGQLTLEPPPEFSPAVGDIYVVESVKDVNSIGHASYELLSPDRPPAVLRLRTYVQWTEDGWRGIGLDVYDESAIVVDARTTALALLAAVGAPDDVEENDEIVKLAVLADEEEEEEELPEHLDPWFVIGKARYEGPSFYEYDDRLTEVIASDEVNAYYTEVLAFLKLSLDPVAQLVYGRPEIDELTTTSGVPGDLLEIRGTGFRRDPAALRVRIGGETAEVLLASENRIVCKVPDLEAGPTSVSVGLSAVKAMPDSTSYTVDPHAKLHDFEDGPVFAGDEVTLWAEGIGTDRWAVRVQLGTELIKPKSISEDEAGQFVTFCVPEGVEATTVRVVKMGIRSNAVPITIAYERELEIGEDHRDGELTTGGVDWTGKGIGSAIDFDFVDDTALPYEIPVDGTETFGPGTHTLASLTLAPYATLVLSGDTALHIEGDLNIGEGARITHGDVEADAGDAPSLEVRVGGTFYMSDDAQIDLGRRRGEGTGGDLAIHARAIDISNPVALKTGGPSGNGTVDLFGAPGAENFILSDGVVATTHGLAVIGEPLAVSTEYGLKAEKLVGYELAQTGDNPAGIEFAVLGFDKQWTDFTSDVGSLPAGYAFRYRIRFAPGAPQTVDGITLQLQRVESNTEI